MFKGAVSLRPHPFFRQGPGSSPSVWPCAACGGRSRGRPGSPPATGGHAPAAFCMCSLPGRLPGEVSRSRGRWSQATVLGHARLPGAIPQRASELGWGGLCTPTQGRASGGRVCFQSAPRRTRLQLGRDVLACEGTLAVGEGQLALPSASVPTAVPRTWALWLASQPAKGRWCVFWRRLSTPFFWPPEPARPLPQCPLCPLEAGGHWTGQGRGQALALAGHWAPKHRCRPWAAGVRGPRGRSLQCGLCPHHGNGSLLLLQVPGGPRQSFYGPSSPGRRSEQARLPVPRPEGPRPPLWGELGSQEPLPGMEDTSFPPHGQLSALGAGPRELGTWRLSPRVLLPQVGRETGRVDQAQRGVHPRPGVRGQSSVLGPRPGVEVILRRPKSESTLSPAPALSCPAAQ